MATGKQQRVPILILMLSFVLAAVPTAQAAQRDAAGPASEASAYDPGVQTPELLYDEARTVYLGNLARRANGVPPLRWNLQLTHAARWFSWDSTENRPDGFCGHDDTLGRAPWDRAYVFGYRGWAGAENAFCGYVTPEDAIQGWMNSPGHRANLLDPAWREIGLGYYRRSSDGRGYVTQDFGSDAVFAPAIIENEAISTQDPDVNLYIYDRSTDGGFAGLGAAIQMQVSNGAHFAGAAWESYRAERAWRLASGEGWRKVYVKTRDKFNRSMTVSDDIYLGPANPPPPLGASQMAAKQSTVTLYNLDGGALPQVQFSLGWLADDTFSTFGKLWGNGERVNDAAAWGGTAFRLRPGAGEASAWVWDTTFIKDAPMVAYFRLKVNDNTSGSEVARVSVEGGGTLYGPLVLQGTDFNAPGQYQEFPLNFTFNSNPNEAFLIFQFWSSGSADVYVDAVSIFTTPQPITSPLTWRVPGGNYRGQGVWVRYTNGSLFSDISEADTVPYIISGQTGAAGTILSYVDGGAKTVRADASGSYSIRVPYGWSGTVTPSHPCFIFTPESRTYENLTDDATGQNYQASPSGVCVSSTFPSAGRFDGWVLESTEASNKGGAMNAAAATFNLGDDAADRQYRAILSFNTSGLPDTAVITKARLKIRRQGIAGTNPFNTHLGLKVDIRTPFFGPAAGLAISDFQAAASKPAAATFNTTPAAGAWYSAVLSPSAYSFINRKGTTQLRLRFAKDDNDDLSADFLRFYSGNALPASYRPVLVVEYYVP